MQNFNFLSFLSPPFSLFLGQEFWAKDKRYRWVSIIPAAESHQDTKALAADGVK